VQERAIVYTMFQSRDGVAATLARKVESAVSERCDLQRRMKLDMVLQGTDETYASGVGPVRFREK